MFVNYKDESIKESIEFLQKRIDNLSNKCQELENTIEQFHSLQTDLNDNQKEKIDYLAHKQLDTMIALSEICDVLMSQGKVLVTIDKTIIEFQDKIQLRVLDCECVSREEFLILTSFVDDSLSEIHASLDKFGSNRTFGSRSIN
jgi:16S rRNA G527 N7-methylase RsmG